MNGTRLLQYLRIPLLVVLLAAATVPEQEFFRAFTRLELDAARQPWFLIVVSGLAFVAVSLWGRTNRHPPGLLAVEGLVAAVLGLVPPMVWVQWFGVGLFLGVATGNMFVHALALAWLGVVLATAIRQARGPGPRSPSPGVPVDASRGD